MLKDDLLKAVKDAAAAFNSGISADMAVAKTASAADFNADQTDRLVEMFNTAAALNKEADNDDPTGSCELADKKKVAKLMLDGAEGEKSASSHSTYDYSFYGSEPIKTNKTISAHRLGAETMAKAASAEHEEVIPELDVSQDSLYASIDNGINMLKRAGDAAEDVVSALEFEIERSMDKVAKFLGSSECSDDMVDLFKVACDGAVCGDISSRCERLAVSDGGKYRNASVFDSSSIDWAIKEAEEISGHRDLVRKYESKRDFYYKQASDARNRMREILGISGRANEKKASLADMFDASGVSANDEDYAGSVECEIKIASDVSSLMKKAGISPEEVVGVLGDLEKSARIVAPIVNTRDAIDALAWSPGRGGTEKRLANVRRAMVLADLMTNDPIISEAEPGDIVEAYKTMVMTSPRVSLDKAQVRSFLRAAVNSVAVSPSDAKVLTDVDKGTRFANIDKLTMRDSSIKDSNE